MKAIKFLTKEGWIALYASILKKTLLCDNNLADLTNKQEARKNLELVEDVDSHNHDSRYKPMITTVKNELIDMINSLKFSIEQKDMLETLSGNISVFINKKNGYYKWHGTLDNIEADWIILKTDSLYTASNINDPRVVLRSNDLDIWCSAYAYWHA